MRRVIKSSLLFFAVLCGNQSVAQAVEMADGLRAEGKIFVVVAVVLVILLGLFGYLLVLDRKLKKLESERNGAEE